MIAASIAYTFQRLSTTSFQIRSAYMRNVGTLPRGLTIPGLGLLKSSSQCLFFQRLHQFMVSPYARKILRWIDQGSAPKDIKFLVWSRSFTRWERARKLRAKENPVTAITVLG